jgi:hypothetical protein
MILKIFSPKKIGEKLVNFDPNYIQLSIRKIDHAMAFSPKLAKIDSK